MKNFEDIVFSRTGRYVGIGLGALIVAALIFHMGYAAGLRGAYGMHGMQRVDSDDNRPPFLQPFGNPSMPRGFIPGGHGLIGTITAVNGSTVALQTRDGQLRTILLATSTVIKAPPGATSTTLISQGEILVVGEPNEEGNIQAIIIQILPTK